jgi:hypothetical protein
MTLGSYNAKMYAFEEPLNAIFAIKIGCCFDRKILNSTQKKSHDGSHRETFGWYPRSRIEFAYKQMVSPTNFKSIGTSQF